MVTVLDLMLEGVNGYLCGRNFYYEPCRLLLSQDGK